MLHNLDTPTICSLNGGAAGYGLDLALGCDLRIAGESAKLNPGFAKQGILPESGAPGCCPGCSATAKAAEVAFTGRTLLAKEAHELGLVNCAVADADLPAATAELAGEIAANAPLAVRAIKRMMRAVGDRDLRAERSPRVPPTPTAAPHAGLPGRCGGVHGEAPGPVHRSLSPPGDEATMSHGFTTDRLADRPPRPTHSLRGVNLSGATKVPVTPPGATHLGVSFDGWADVSFVGRPAPLDEVDAHLDRIAGWGLNCLRLLTTWEAIEHAVPVSMTTPTRTTPRSLGERLLGGCGCSSIPTRTSGAAGRAATVRRSGASSRGPGP